MRNRLIYLYLILNLLLLHCTQRGSIPRDIVEAYPEAVTVQVKNTAGFSHTDGSFSLSVDDLKVLDSRFNPHAFVVF
ncbi:MAG: hypothetical protein ACETWG_09050 [Candidatus Neomarinimicrobiota bacterium]